MEGDQTGQELLEEALRKSLEPEQGAPARKRKSA